MQAAHHVDQHDPIDHRFDVALQRHLDQALRKSLDETVRVSPVAEGLVEAINRLLTGGKRLRSRLALWAWAGHSSDTDHQDLGNVAVLGASLEYFQAAALLHDDLIDRSATRRGLATAHVEFEALHAREQRVGSAQQFGMAGAILAGDLALITAQQLASSLYDSADRHTKPTLSRVAALWHEMATEVTAGQFLDLTAQSLPNWGSDSIKDQELAFAIITAKSARYSVELPLTMGATLAGASPIALSHLAEFGRPLGEAFQLRDDLLGVFGDPSITGKPAGDDIREGKRTLLMAVTAQRAQSEDRKRLISILDDINISDDDINWANSLVREVEADRYIEKLISERYTQALEALAQCELTSQSRTRLEELARALVQRVA